MGFYVIANALTRLLPHGLHYTIDRLQPSAPQQKGRGYRNINIFIPLRGAITTKGVYASCVWRIKLRWEVNESLLYKINFQQPLMRISLWGVTHLSNVIYQSTPFCLWLWGKKIINAKQPILYSYLMGVDAIDQSICPEVLGMTKGQIVWSIASTPIK